jgi:hypothetical protein
VEHGCVAQVRICWRLRDQFGCRRQLQVKLDALQMCALEGHSGCGHFERYLVLIYRLWLERWLVQLLGINGTLSWLTDLH